MYRVARADPEKEFAAFAQAIRNWFGADAYALQREYLESAFAATFSEQRQALLGREGPYRLGTTRNSSCEALYVTIRAAKPDVLVETGVLYGASTAHILAALERNGRGELFSIDLGTADDEPNNDYFVPSALKPRWNLIIGDSRQRLPELLDRVGPIDFFHHDSLHTSEHMMWEFAQAFAALRPGGLLSSDDVLIAHSLREVWAENAFTRFCGAKDLPRFMIGNAGLARVLPRAFDSPPEPGDKRRSSS